MLSSDGERRVRYRVCAICVTKRSVLQSGAGTGYKGSAILLALVLSYTTESYE